MPLHIQIVFGATPSIPNHNHSIRTNGTRVVSGVLLQTLAFYPNPTVTLTLTLTISLTPNTNPNIEQHNFSKEITGRPHQFQNLYLS